MDKIQELELRIDEYKKTVRQQEREIDSLRLSVTVAERLENQSDRYLKVIEKLLDNVGPY